MRKPFIKNLNNIPIEEAHGGTGSRQVILSSADDISKFLQAMTKGFLKAGGVFDWHKHENVDEFWLVLKGTGVISYEDGTNFDYKPGDIVYNPADLMHKIENSINEDAEYFFIRLDA